MRLCFIAHQATKEGAGLFMVDQIDYLQRRGVTLYAILPSGGPLHDAMLERGVETAVVPSAWWIRPHWHESADAYAEALTAARRMAALMRGWAVDVAYTQTVVAPAGPIAAALAGVPHIWHIHEFSYNPRAIEMGLSRAALARLIDLTSNFVFFNSQAVAGEWRDLIPGDKSRVVYNWVSPVADDAAPDISDAVARSLIADKAVCVAIIVGSIVPWKRQMDAVRAVGALLNEGLNVALLVVGPAVVPSFHAELVAVVEQNGWANRIRFVGYVEHPRRLMRAAHVGLLCSDNEPFGRVTVESMAEGTPIIGTNSGGTAEIITDGVDGLLFPVGDVARLTEQLRSVVQDAGLRARLSTAARTRANRYLGPESAMPPVVEILDTLAGRRNPVWPLGDMIARALGSELSNVTARDGIVERGRRLLRKLRDAARGAGRA